MKKAVIITGAGSGIGAATALEFAKNGYFPFLLGRRVEQLLNVVRQCGEGEAISCDVTQPESVAKAFSTIKNFGAVTVETLVNNAGIFDRHDFSASDEVWAKQFEVNLFGAVRVTRETIPFIRHHGKGAIVNISSTLGLKPTAETAAYSASKAAMNNWTQSLALELGKYNIRVNCICPGIVDTPIHAFHNLDPSQKAATLEGMKNLQPLGRIGTPADIAKAAFFLGSEASPWTTGAILSVDGGINIA
jgi:NAD(P)-dependent dehydrogenase (short-subunit alcohol dehydrogenase family)